MESSDFSIVFTALATGLLVLVGTAQTLVLLGQRRQQRLDWAEVYRRRWADSHRDWGTVVFLGREHGSYYQIATLETLQELRIAAAEQPFDLPSIWAREAVRNVCGLLSEVCMSILQGQLLIREAYPIFGTGLLRNGAALRALLDNTDAPPWRHNHCGPAAEEHLHDELRNEVRTWLVCHDGIRRRCLILLDLLWAEAARLEDLPPDDLRSAAQAKARTGHLNRQRLQDEARRLGGRLSWLRTKQLKNFLRHSEFRKGLRSAGLTPARLATLEQEWTKRYLNEP